MRGTFLFGIAAVTLMLSSTSVRASTIMGIFDPESGTSVAAHAANTNATALRIMLNSDGYTRDPEYNKNLAKVVAEIKAFKAVGFNTFMLSLSSDTCSGSAHGCAPMPDYPQSPAYPGKSGDFASYVTNILTDLESNSVLSDITSIEVWNEWDNHGLYGPKGGSYSVSNYITYILQPAYETIQAFNGKYGISIKTVLGGTVNWSDISTLISLKGYNYLDGYNYHPYATNGSTVVSYIEGAANAALKASTSAGVKLKPMYATEWGCASWGTTNCESILATSGSSGFIAQAMAAFKSEGYVEADFTQLNGLSYSLMDSSAVCDTFHTDALVYGGSNTTAHCSSGNGILTSSGGTTTGSTGTKTGSSASIYLVSEASPSYCANIWANGKTAGTLIKAYSCGGANEQFKLNSSGQLTAWGGTLCVGVANHGTSNGALIELAACDTTKSDQIWKFTPASTGSTTGSFSNGSGKCLDLYDFEYKDGGEIDLYTCKGGANQQWTMSTSP